MILNIFFVQKKLVGFVDKCAYILIHLQNKQFMHMFNSGWHLTSLSDWW